MISILRPRQSPFGSASVGTRSLDPSRSTPSDHPSLLAMFDGQDGRRIDATADALDRIAVAIARHFPENVFADLEYLAESLWKLRDPSDIRLASERIVGLLRGFGCESSIRFRYVHDFLYGFDWARWVSKDPFERAGVAPFDATFLGYLERRRIELEHTEDFEERALGVLEPETYRNPFCFTRGPSEEIRLHRRLAEHGLIPVKAWERGGDARWDLPFTEIRALIAIHMGFARRATSGFL